MITRAGFRPSGWILTGLLFQAALSGPTTAHAAALASVEVPAGRRIPEWIINPDPCRTEKLDGHACLAIAPDRDPYAKVEWEIRLTLLSDLVPTTVTLEIEFVDRGAGVIEPRLGPAEGSASGWVSPRRRSSYTRLNTGAVRRAWFEFATPKRDAPDRTLLLRVAGLQHLTAVRLLPAQDETAWAQVKSAVPRRVEPMVKLRRPMELVTTAGVDVVGDLSALESSLDALNDLAPLARVLGFTSIESYVTWKRLEPRREGEFDFAFYDAIVRRLAEYDLKWFPLLIVGSGYALPEWFMQSEENHGFVCLEHGLTNAIQSIWAPTHRRHVTRVLQAFGKHYEPMGVLEGVRLGPSGNYGESQYPAGGNWGPGGGSMHIHIGWWAGESRRAMPRTRIYQSAGGWGFRETGTDYSAQTKAMKAVDGGATCRSSITGRTP